MELLVLVALLLVDQLSKIYIFNVLTPDTQINVIGSFFYIDATFNRGAAFGILQGGALIFIAVSLIMIAVVIILSFYEKRSHHTIIPEVMLLAGISGNVLDRIFYGGVRDFLGIARFSVMNFADWFISIGILLIIVKFTYHYLKDIQINKNLEDRNDK